MAAGVEIGDGGFDAVRSVVGGLPDSDRAMLLGRNHTKYRDLPRRLVSRAVAYDGGSPVGFADVWGVDGKGRVLRSPSVAVAVSDKARGKRVASAVVRAAVLKAVERARAERDSRLRRFVWRLYLGNDASARAAEHAGFTEQRFSRPHDHRQFVLTRGEAGRMGKEAAARIDIPSVYDEVRKAYAGMGYPVSGDRLVLSEQPTYVDGRPVPKDVIRPNSSGGNTQDDGTVRINPRYRAVMRHWGLKGPGRDFLRTIIGHELGHHVDRTVLSGRSAERRRLLQEIARSGFHTVYTDSYGPDTDPRKLDKELLAEYLADMVRRRLEKKAADRNFLSAFGDLARMPQTASNPSDDDIRAAFSVDPAKVRGHDTVPHFMAAVESVNPQMGRRLWGMARGRVIPRVSVFSGSTPRGLRSTADDLVAARQSWPNGVNTAYAALTNMYDRVVRKTGRPVWDVQRARPTPYGMRRDGIGVQVR